MADVSFNTVASNKKVLNFLHNVFSETSGRSGLMNLLSINSHSCNSHIEKKSVENTLKLLEKCEKSYQNSKLNLKNSPPFLIGTISDMQVLLNHIILSYKNRIDELLNITYFKVMLLSVMDISEQVIKNFKESKDIFDITSPDRKKLTRLSLIFSHLYKTFYEFFPKGVYCVDMFRITKLDAANWWKTHFSDQTIVPWKTFYESLATTYKLNDLSQSLALKNTINLCCNNYVTVYEFDVFVRLFQPWNNILETWKALAVLHPGYMSFMTYDDVRLVLLKFIDFPGPGTFVFRSSCTKLGQWAIGYVTEDKQILQTIIQNKSLARALLDGEKEGYYKYPNGSTTYNGYQDLYSLVHNLTATHIQVSHEQYKVYCEMDSTFELCKICSENDKNIRLEPCQHLLCKPCLLSWQLSSGQSCPFCRLEIKSIEEIVVKPYNSAGIRCDLLEKLHAPPLPPRSQQSMPPNASPTSGDSDTNSSRFTGDFPPELNYATLDFQDLVESVPPHTSKGIQVDFSGCPDTPPPLLLAPIPQLSSSLTTTTAITAESTDNDNNNPEAIATVESNMRLLVECDLIDERVAKLLLRITENDIAKSRTILKYFKIKDDIIF